MPGLRRLVMLILVALGGAYLLLCIAVFMFQRRLVFPAPETAAAPRRGTLIPVAGGTVMLWVPPTRPDAPVLVHFHGNGESVVDAEELAGLLAPDGVGVAAIEYPGYPRAAGSPSERSILAAAEAGLRQLTGPMGIARDRLVLSGQSLGTGVAVELAARGWGRRLLLLSPFTSLPAVGARAFPFLPVRLLMLDRFDSEARAPGLKVPVLIIHGTEDEVVHFDLGKTLSTRIPRAEFLRVEHGHHNDLWNRPEVREAVRTFVSTR